MKKEKGGSLVLLISAMVLIVAGSTFLLNERFQFVKTKVIENKDMISDTVPYKNPIYGFQVEYSKIFSFKESSDRKSISLIPSGKSIDNTDDAILITVRHKSGDPETSKRPLAEYAKTAATEEIQNYNELASIDTITTESGEIGYLTTWKRQAPSMNGVVLNSKNEPSDPIAYFELPEEPYYTVQVYLNDKAYLSEFNQILKTFSTKTK